MKTNDPSTYYLKRRKKYDRDFKELRGILKRLLVKRKGDAFAAEADSEVIKEYERLFSRLPYIGGDANRQTWNLASSVAPLAFYKALKARGVELEEIGDLTYRVMQGWYGMLPKVVLRFAGMLKMSTSTRKKIRQAALWSSSRRYADDWVYDFVEGGPEKDFDFGVDYSECGIEKFYKVQGAAEFTPYICLFDYVTSECLGMGMRRTTTIAEGAAICDFRFKRGRQTEPGWPPSFIKNRES